MPGQTDLGRLRGVGVLLAIAAIECLPRATHEAVGELGGACPPDGTCHQGKCVAWDDSPGAHRTCEIPCSFEPDGGSECPPGYRCGIGVDVSPPPSCVRIDPELDAERARAWRRVREAADAGRSTGP